MSPFLPFLAPFLAFSCKLKGFATVRLASGRMRQAEVHWYEAHGVGRKGFKIKRFLD